MLQINNGRLAGAQWCPSPNFDQRPEGVAIDTIVVHCISLPPGKYGACNSDGERYIDLLFCNSLDKGDHTYFADLEGLRVSSHLFIDRSGEITQYVNFAERAWHAGQSCLKGRVNCNDFSVGIELEGSDEDWYTDQQYRVLAESIASLQQAYPSVSSDRIVGHEHIAPGRKTDPGPYFDWSRLREILSSDKLQLT